MIKAIIFDLNGVFVKSPKLSDRFERDFGIPKDIFMPALQDAMAQVRLPNAKDYFEYWKPYFKEWGLSLKREEFLNYWFRTETLDDEMVEFAKELKVKNIKLFILSNNLRERSVYYAEHFKVLNEIFDKMYFSWQTGFVKPDIMAYENILKENNLKPEECVYFDDSEKNIKIANFLGIKSFLFKGIDKIKEVLNLYL